MDKFDEKIKAMAKSEDWKIPSSIDNNISSLLKNIDKPNKVRKPLKVAILVASISILTVTTAFAVEHIIEYFNYNKNSSYIYDKKEFEKYGSIVNLSNKDKGIELAVDSISIDDNYINVFYTIKSDKSIKEYFESSGEKKPEESYFASPFLGAKVNGKDITVSGTIEQEATYISENELKGIYRFNIVSFDFEDEFNINIHTDEIYRQQGNWSISTNVDKSKSKQESKTYNLDQDIKVNKTYEIDKKNIDIEHNIYIDKVTLSPFANQIFIKEKVKMMDNWEPMIGGGFALFDENNKSLDVLDKGYTGADPRTSIAENSFEFLKANMDTKTLTFVPIGYKDVANEVLEPQVIKNLPIEFKMSEFGKLVIEEIEINDKEIKITYYRDGVVPHYPNFILFDENGKQIQVQGLLDESIDRHTGRYTSAIKLDGYENNINDILNIKKISTFNNNGIKLLYDQQVKINLSSNKR